MSGEWTDFGNAAPGVGLDALIRIEDPFERLYKRLEELEKRVEFLEKTRPLSGNGPDGPVSYVQDSDPNK